MSNTGTKAFTFEEVLTSSDVNRYLMRGVKVYDTTTDRDNSYGGAGEPVLYEGEVCYVKASDEVQAYNGGTWVKIGPTTVPTPVFTAAGAAIVSTGQTTTSTSFVDLATAGPSVTLTTGTAAIIVVSSIQSNSNANANADVGNMFHSFAVSGASTIGAADTTSARGGQTYGSQIFTRSGLFYLNNLTAGSNTFTSKYRVGDGTGTFRERTIAVWAL